MTPATHINITSQQTDSAEQPCAPPGWYIAPAIIAGAGIWAALIWLAPAAAGVLAVACGAVVLWGM